MINQPVSRPSSMHKLNQSIAQKQHYQIPSYNNQPINPEAVSYFNVHQYSQVQQVPFMNTRTQYQQREVIDKVAVEKIVIEQREVRKTKKIPKERKVIDYIPVQKQVFYMPTYIPQKRIEYVPVQVVTQKLEYVPRSRSIIQMPHQKQGIEGYNTHRPNTNDLLNINSNQYSTPHKSNFDQKQYQSTNHKHNLSSSRPSSARRHSLIATTPINYLNRKNFDWKFDNNINTPSQKQIIIKDAKQSNNQHKDWKHEYGRNDQMFSFSSANHDKNNK